MKFLIITVQTYMKKFGFTNNPAKGECYSDCRIAKFDIKNCFIFMK
jgi:hypothetical protein